MKLNCLLFLFAAGAVLGGTITSGTIVDRPGGQHGGEIAFTFSGISSGGQAYSMQINNLAASNSQHLGDEVCFGGATCTWPMGGTYRVTMSPLAFLSGSIVWGGVTYDFAHPYAARFTVHLTADPVTVPSSDSPIGNPGLRYSFPSAPFSVSMDVAIYNGCTTDSASCQTLAVSDTLTGLGSYGGTGDWVGHAGDSRSVATFAFTPEPATALLILAAIPAAWPGRRARRR